MSEQEDIEDFISRVVSETEDLSDLKRLALDINRVGSKFADKTEAYSKRLSNIDRRLSRAEDDFDNMVQRLMVAPPGTINTRNLKIRGGSGSASPGIPSTNMKSTPAAPSVATSTAGPAAAGPNLKAGPAPTAAPTTPGPNLAASPPSGGPNLAVGPATTGPNLSAGPVSDGPNLKAGPAAAGPNLKAGPAPGGPTSLAGGIANALANLKKAPERDESAASTGGGGITAGGIQSALANLKKAPERDEKPGAGGPLGGFNPAEALKALKKAPRKDEGEEEEEEKPKSEKSEFASILEKRRQTTEAEIEGKPVQGDQDKTIEQSAEDMKAQLQSRLKSAFKK